MAEYRNSFSVFVDDLIAEVSSICLDSNDTGTMSWLICGTDTNAHFKGSGRPPRQEDDWAATEVRRFMETFDLISLAERYCPSRSTRINSRGHQSCLDTFLVSRWLQTTGKITQYEVIDWMETGSDHCPVYVRVKVYPYWSKSPLLPSRRILKTSGIRDLESRVKHAAECASLTQDINAAFTSVKWANAVNRNDMDVLWSEWVEAFDNRKAGRKVSWYSSCYKVFLGKEV